MNIIIGSSISAADEVITVQKQLEKLGHRVEIPEGIKNDFLRNRTDVSSSEKAGDKITYDLLRGYYEKIKTHDAVLVVNPQKRGIKDYIGANTLIEMAFAHVLGKKLYVLYSIPDVIYTAEILATQPIVLQGNLQLLFL